MKFLKYIKNTLSNNSKRNKLKALNISINMRTHIEKYEETYKLLEEYDKKSIKDSELLAESGRLRDTIERVQGSPRSRRTHPAV